MVKKVKNWENIENEFDAQTTVVELIQKYIDSYSLKKIDQEYLEICQPLVDNHEISKRQLGEM